MDKTYTVIKGERGSGRIFHLERALSVKSAQLAAANKEVSRLEETNVSLQNTISILMCEVERLNEAQQWISVKDKLPQNFVSVLGYMTDAGEFPPVRECYTVGNAFFFPALGDVHPVSHWCEMPQPPKGE